MVGGKEYSWRTDWLVNAWLLIAVMVSAGSEIMFPHVVREWSAAVRTLLVVTPFVCILLWSRSLTNWIRGMDELHRRITTSAVMFAVSATFFILMLWHRLDTAGVLQVIFQSGKHSAAIWDIATVGHGFLLMTFFYLIGYSVFNRRYV